MLLCLKHDNFRTFCDCPVHHEGPSNVYMKGHITEFRYQLHVVTLSMKCVVPQSAIHARSGLAPTIYNYDVSVSPVDFGHRHVLETARSPLWIPWIKIITVFLVNALESGLWEPKKDPERE